MTALAERVRSGNSRPESVSSRYAVTLAAQGVRFLVAMVSAAIVPRALGPTTYGNYSYLLSTAATLRAILDNGAQQAFFTFSAREETSGGLTKLYAAVLAVQFAITLVILGVAAAMELGWLWHGLEIQQIALVTILDWLMFLALSLQQLGDSKGRTVLPQLAGAAVSILVMTALVLLWRADALDFYAFVGVSVTGAAINVALLSHIVIYRDKGLFWRGNVAFRDYVRRWWRFAKPLIPLQYYLPLVGYVGLYVIQRWYGPEEQAYYALALQWSSLAMIFTNAAVSIFWREIAHGMATGRSDRAAATYLRFSRLFLFLVFVLACWLSATSELLVGAVAGDQYQGAVPVLAIMAFYPVAQTIGQLTAASLKAVEDTASFARWSFLLSVPDLVLTYLLLAPETAPLPGLELGAVGMAIKTAFYGLLSVQVYDWLNCRLHGLNFVAGMRHRIGVMVTIAMAAYLLLVRFSEWLRGAGLDDATSLLLSSSSYIAVIIAVVWIRPELAGMKRGQMRATLSALGRRDPMVG